MNRIRLWTKYSLTHTHSRLAILITLTLFVTVTATGLISYNVSKNVLKSEINQPEMQSLMINQDQIEKLIKKADRIAIEILFNPFTNDFLKNENVSHSNTTNLIAYLSSFKVSENFKAIYVYDSSNRKIVSSDGGYVSDPAYLADTSWLHDTETVDKMAIVNGHTDSGSSRVTLYRSIVINGKKAGMVVIDLKPDVLFAGLRPKLSDSIQKSLMITDDKQDLVYAFSAPHAISDPDRSILSQFEQQGYAEKKMDGQKIMFFYLTSRYTGWKYVSYIPSDLLLENIGIIRTIVWTLSLLFVAIGIISIAYYNQKAFKPLRRMQQLLGKYKTDYRKADLLDIERFASKMLEDHTMMTRQIRESVPESRRRLIESIFFNKISLSEMRHRWELHFPDWSNDCFITANMSIDQYEEWSKHLGESDVRLFKFAMQNMSEEMLSKTDRLVIMEHGDEGFIILLQPLDNEQDTLAATIESLRKLQSEVDRLLKLSVTIGISQPVTDYAKLQAGYRQSLSAVQCRFFDGYGKVHLFADHGYEDAGRLNDRWSDDMIAQLAAGNLDAAKSVLSELFDVIASRNYSPSELLGVLEHVQLNLEQLAIKNGDDGFAMYSGLSTMHADDIRQHFLSLMDEINRKVEQKLTSKPSVMVSRMVDYMERHYNDNIGVKEIADSVGASIYSANQWFKQESGQTVFDYLTKMRLEKAKGLLKTTDLKVFEIALMVGYQNENSFIRAFRNYTKITPGKYRELDSLEQI
ncbi:helix-turn-helix domain-containing protein [Paenibacillus arenilitoris]|uniref:AraC family transcriptional regulator n=1 Tax=Paenibacillus arenilitoris TaxID=2772299 RepID=A0A927CVH8_9BACL|nr:helix-turn-helix domain-containing protein [Paenibacillus arenilitoris]MBD2872305.1 AraC family transcriptional regulator [Paenibacillus arenilitoris]